MQTRQQEYRQKHEAVVEYMDTHRLDAVILTRRCNFAWYTCGGMNHVATAVDVGVASLLIKRKGAVCITNTIERPRVWDEELGELGIEVESFAWYDGDEAGEVWKEELGDCSAACDLRVGGLGGHVDQLGNDFDRLRWSLTEGEIERYRSLAPEVAGCLESVCRQARPGMSEHDLAGMIAGSLVERGIRAPVLLVAADERVRLYRHPIPTGRKIADYGMAVCCGERGGLYVSSTRLFSFKPVDEDLERRHRAVCAVDAAMMAATRPGRTLGEVMAVAQQAYADNGFEGEWQFHHQGGSTGYVSREVKGTPGDDTPILVDQAFGWNPSIAGTKSEDTLLVGEKGNEILSLTGDWPTTEYSAGGLNWSRCDILEL